MATNVRFVDQIKIISTEAGGGDSSISSSYALSASHADFATSASYAEYAVSASHEITKEVSSSYADTASLALSGNGPFTGSFTGSFFGNGSGVFSGSFSGSIPDAYQIISGSVSASISPDNGLRINSPVDITMPSGSVFTIHEPDIDQQNRLDFRFDQGNPMLEISSRSTTSSLYLRSNDTDNGLILDSLGKIKFVSSGTNYGVAFTTSGFNPNAGNQLNLGAYNRRWKDIYVNNGDKISFGVNDSTNIDLVSLRHTVGTNTLVMSGSSDVTLDVKGDLNVSTNITASGNISSSNNIFTKQLYVENNLAIDYDFSHNCISFGNVSDCLNLLGTSITASSNLSSSATSTASFGTYLGDGSQLTGIETDPFPYTGDAQITGSLIISGSFITSRNSDLSNTIIGSSSAAAMNSGATGNVIIGNETAKSLTFGDDNVIIGENAGQSITSGYDNVYIGHNSGLQSHPTNAIGNVVIGVDAGLGSGGGTAYRNVFVGQMAGYNVDGAANVYVGWQAGRGEAGADGTANSGFGAFALTDNRDGNYNIGIGYYAGGAIKDGSNNIFIGSGSLGELSTEAQLRIGHADLITISASLATGDIIFPSTASAAYFVGDGSQLTGIETDPFPYTGDAVISGSLTVQSGSSNSITGITLINPSSPGTTQDTGAGITMFNYTGATGSIHIKDYTSGGVNPYHPAMIFNSSDAFFFQAADDARDGTWFTAQKVYQNFHMDQISNNAAEWIMGINNGGSSYSRLVIGQGGTTANGWFFQNNGYDEDLKIGETTGAGGTGTYTNRILISSSRMQIGDSSNDLKLSVSGSITSNNTASAAYFVGDGSQLTNLPASSANNFGIAQGSGSFTYYSSLSASMAAATSGDTIQMFSDYVEKTTSVSLKDGVTLDGNGFTYTFSGSGTENALEETSAATSTIYLNNLIVKRIGGAAASLTENLVLYVGASNQQKTIYNQNVLMENDAGCVIRTTGGGLSDNKIYDITARGTTYGIYHTYGSIYHSKGYATTGTGIYGSSNSGNLYQSYGESEDGVGIYAARITQNCVGVSGDSYGLQVAVNSTYGTVMDCIGISTGTGAGDHGIYNTSTSGILQDCEGYGNAGAGIYSNQPSEIVNCTGNSKSGYGIYLRQASAKAINCHGHSVSGYAAYSHDGGKFLDCSFYAQAQHGILVANSNTDIIGCSIEVEDASKNCIYASSARDIDLAKNIYKGATTAVNANLTNTCTNVPDNQGNIHVTSSVAYNYDFTGATAISGSTLLLSGSLLNSGTVSLDNTASPYTLTGTQQFILIDPSGGDVTVNMPDAATYPGREIRFKLTQAAGANTVTLQRQGADTIDGATTYTDLDIQYESISTVSNGGTGWFIF